MEEKRTGTDRRSGFDRRREDASEFNGPERRSVMYRRVGKDRRAKG